MVVSPPYLTFHMTVLQIPLATAGAEISMFPGRDRHAPSRKFDLFYALHEIRFVGSLLQEISTS